MVSKYLGFDQLIESVLEKVGDLEAAYVVGDYAAGVDSGTIELVLVGNVYTDVIDDLVERVESRINRKIKYSLISEDMDGLVRPNLKLFWLVWSMPKTLNFDNISQFLLLISQELLVVGQKYQQF